MTVGDLDFKLSISGADNVQDEIQDISDKLLQLQSLATSLDGKEIDIEANIERDGSLAATAETVDNLKDAATDDSGDLGIASAAAEGKESIDDLAESAKESLDFADEIEIPSFKDALQDVAVSRGDIDELDIGVEVDDSEIQNLQAKVSALDQQDIDIGADLDAGRGNLLGSGAERDEGGEISGLSGALRRQSLTENLSRLNDEAFAVASILAGLPCALTATVSGFAVLGIAAAGAVAAE